MESQIENRNTAPIANAGEALGEGQIRSIAGISAATQQAGKRKNAKNGKSPNTSVRPIGSSCATTRS
jgi:hypothetical protein